jgi:hypothetical protein
MLCAFEGAPRIMRLFGTGTIHRVGTPRFNVLFSKHYTSDNCDIHASIGKRSIIVVDVYKVGSSCGYGVPFYDYKGSRPTLTNYWGKKSEHQVADYWVKKNTTSLDGLPGMRHEMMGEKWLPSLITKGGRKGTEVDGEGEDEGSWWELGSVWANATLVAAGAGFGAAVASYVFKQRRH